MSSNSQHLRRSQFVLTFGPGAILEGPAGPRLIPNPEQALFSQGMLRDMSPREFEIVHRGLSVGLLDEKRIFRLPSNAELSVNPSYYLYKTIPFPTWSLCVDHNILYKSSDGCPKCDSKADHDKRTRETIRFVLACPRGHLDDVPWHSVVHRSACNWHKWYFWRNNGPSLKDIEIVCPKCGQKGNLGQAYAREWLCSGHRPERQLGWRPGCTERARIVQRQASNLFIPDVVSLFTIPPRCTRLHRLLSVEPIPTALDFGQPRSLADLKRLLGGLVQKKRITAGCANDILSHDWAEIRSAIQDTLEEVPDTYEALLDREFTELRKASIHGFPPHGRARPLSSPLMEVIPGNVRRISGPAGIRLRVVPISKLNTVIVQRGFRRLSPDPSRSILSSHAFQMEDGSEWLPGVEFTGEGIFIMLDDHCGWHFEMRGKAALSWKRARASATNEQYPKTIFRGESRGELHPVFIWWHTLAHALIKALAIDSGYSSASIRERVYLEVDERRGMARGGIVLYTAQPGADGTLGGLVSLVSHFEHMLQRALEIVAACSNDPLCDEHQFVPGLNLGAACYSCLLVSETSCEHRNMWLDRHVLLEALP